MFSGKTTELIRRLKRCEIGGLKVLCLKSSKDTRTKNAEFLSRDGPTYNASVIHIPLPTYLRNEMVSLMSYDVIGIDEGQFFSDIASFANDLANMGKIIIVAALDTDFQGTSFPAISELITQAEIVLKLTAICGCGHEASRTMRVNSTSKELFVVGGEDIYRAACRQCFSKYHNPSSNTPSS